VSKRDDNIVIAPELRALIPALRTDEYAGLEEQLLAEGCRDALVVWPHNGVRVLLDGHNRKEICDQHGIPFTTIALELASRDEARLWILRNQASRRNLSDDQRAIILDEIIEQQSVVVRARQLAAARSAKAAKASGISVLDTVSKTERAPINTRAELSAQYHLGQRKAKYAKLLRKDRAARQAVKEGRTLLADAVRSIRKAEMAEQLSGIEAMQAKEVKGTFDVICADPAWDTNKIARDCRPMDVQFGYPPMALEEIKATVGEMLQKHAEPNCLFFLWTIHGFLPDAIDLVREWGLQYCLAFTWMKTSKNGKPVGMKPFDLPTHNTELCIYARLGNPKFISTKAFYTGFHGLRRGHSVKPREFYETIARVTCGRRLDMFARERHEGFVPWGKEAPVCSG
jgi:N6-adenosine-specific RNA methylase IME4